MMVRASSSSLPLWFAFVLVFVVGCGGPEAQPPKEQPTPAVTTPEPAPEPAKPLAEPPAPVSKKADAIKSVGTMDGLELTDYPGAKPDGKGNKASTATTEDYTFNFTTADSPTQVVDFYKPQLTVEDSYADEATGFAFGKTKSGYEATVNASVMEGKTSITIVVIKPK